MMRVVAENGQAEHPWSCQSQLEWRGSGAVKNRMIRARRGSRSPQGIDATNRRRFIAAQPERTPSAAWRPFLRGAHAVDHIEVGPWLRNWPALARRPHASVFEV